MYPQYSLSDDNENDIEFFLNNRIDCSCFVYHAIVWKNDNMIYLYENYKNANKQKQRKCFWKQK